MAIVSVLTGQIRSKKKGHEITQNRSADMHYSEPTKLVNFSQIIHFLWDILGSDFQYFWVIFFRHKRSTVAARRLFLLLYCNVEWMTQHFQPWMYKVPNTMATSPHLWSLDGNTVWIYMALALSENRDITPLDGSLLWMKWESTIKLGVSHFQTSPHFKVQRRESEFGLPRICVITLPALAMVIDVFKVQDGLSI